MALPGTTVSIADLTVLMRRLEPVLNPGTYVFAMADEHRALTGAGVVASVREPEGLSLILEESAARMAGLTAVYRCAWITLSVNSDLSAVGLTAAFATALADAGISSNVVAGLNHDHLFVPVDQAARAMECLRALQQGSAAKT